MVVNGTLYVIMSFRVKPLRNLSPTIALRGNVPPEGLLQGTVGLTYYLKNV